ncbi:MAG TPA: putative sugar nucleotidyl transferase [Gemmataceae bacterium]|jgi:UDP-N-acetylglucosamine diphosphorylase/glucosamine-1-phosphate N-acetyltransferase
MRICVFEDNAVGRLQPLTDTRPAFDLRLGARTLLQRQLHAFGAERGFAFVRPELADLCRVTHPELTVNSLGGRQDDKVLFINARWLPPANSLRAPKSGEICLCDGQLAYACLPAGNADLVHARDVSGRVEEWARKPSARTCGGRMITYPWDLLVHQAEALEQDHLYWGRKSEARMTAAAPTLGPSERCLIHPSARVEPMVLIDTTRGPVLIDAEAVVQAFSRIEGPCYIGPRTQVLGAKLRGTSLGPECRIGGEVEASIVQGYSNKAHEGFLGHSYLGEWVNLGAGTQVSDLRTDYGNVRINVGGESIDTGLMKVGAFMGDHTRTSISALVNTGSVFGSFDLLLTSSSLLPRSLPSFCRFGHGEIQEQNDLRQLFASATIAMARRGQKWTETHAEFYFQLHERTAEARRRYIRDHEQRRLRRAV